VNSWTKRAIGVAALAGGLLALGAGTASADEVSAGASVRGGSAPIVEVRLCGDGVALSGLLGRCGGQAGSGGDGTTVQAGATRARVRVAGIGSADGSLETRPSRPRVAVTGRARIARPAGLGPSVATAVAADTSPRARVAVETASPSVRPLGDVSARPSATALVAIMLAREGMADGADAAATVDLATPPATADAAVTVGHDAAATDADAAVEVDLLGATDPAEATVDATVAVGHDATATDADVAVGLDLFRPAEETAATVDAAVTLGHDAAATDADAAVAVGLGPLGAADDPAATLDATLALGHDAAATDADADVAVALDVLSAGDDPAAATVDAAVALGRDAAATVDAAVALGRDATATGADADVVVALGPLGAGDDPAATADANLAVGLPGLGDPGSAAVDAAVELGLSGVGVPALDGVAPGLPAPVGDLPLDDPLGGIELPQLGIGGLVPSTSAEVCVGDCAAGTGNGSGGTPSPTQPSPTQPSPSPAPSDGSGGQDTSTGGIGAPDGSGLTGTDGMLAGAAGGAGATLARVRSALADSGGTLAFTGGATDLLALMALVLLMAGAMLLRAARPAPVSERR
jgi:hypothetical protein